LTCSTPPGGGQYGVEMAFAGGRGSPADTHRLRTSNLERKAVPNMARERKGLSACGGREHGIPMAFKWSEKGVSKRVKARRKQRDNGFNKGSIGRRGFAWRARAFPGMVRSSSECIMAMKRSVVGSGPMREPVSSSGKAQHSAVQHTGC